MSARTLFDLGLVLIVLALAATMSGCAPMFNQSMSPDQIKAAVSDRNASVVCAHVIGPWGSADTIVVNLDETAAVNGSVSVGEKCSAVTAGTVKPPAAPRDMPICAAVAFERALDGSCNEVHRNPATCGANFARAAPGKCPPVGP